MMLRKSSTNPALASGAAAVKPESIEQFNLAQQSMDLLRVVTCGSVDDGKSTLIRRMLWETQQILDDQMATLVLDSKRDGTYGQGIDFALLVDGLAVEREHGITIEMAYRHVATARRRFIIADAPGHEQYTRHMIAGASTADAAIMLVDARHGLMTQTRRHAYLASLMGVRHLILVVSKMDLVAFDQGVFQKIVDDFRAFCADFSFLSQVAIPVSAISGDNIIKRSARTPWYDGPTLMAYMESIDACHAQSGRLVFPVQLVSRSESSVSAYSGTLASGALSLGDEIRVTGSGQKALVAGIVGMDGAATSAGAGDAITLILERALDISRGDVMSLASAPLDMTDQFEANIVWMDEDPGMVGRSYNIKLATQSVSASITSIKHRVNIQALSHEACTKLELNDIAVCKFSTGKPVVFDSYKKNKVLGGFIVVDQSSNATVATGLIRHSLRRAGNVHKQAQSIGRAERERLNRHRGQVIWFTGLSGSGKSTIANALEVALHAQGMRTYILDGDNIRLGINKDLGFTDADRVENIRRVAEIAKLMMDGGAIVLTAFISPFMRERNMARDLIGIDNFMEVYVSAPLDVCEQRDPKGLYRRARAGQIPNMTGINSAYEPPDAITYQADSANASVDTIVADLVKIIMSSCTMLPQMATTDEQGGML